MDKSVAAEHPREQREVIHGCDQRAPYVEFHHPRLKTTPLRLEQRGAFGCLLVCFWKVEAVVWVDVSWKDEILSFFFVGKPCGEKIGPTVVTLEEPKREICGVFLFARNELRSRRIVGGEFCQRLATKKLVTVWVGSWHHLTSTFFREAEASS